MDKFPFKSKNKKENEWPGCIFRFEYIVIYVYVSVCVYIYKFIFFLLESQENQTFVHHLRVVASPCWAS